MRLVFFALLGLNAAALVLQLTIWQPEVSGSPVQPADSTEAATQLQLVSETGTESRSRPAPPVEPTRTLAEVAQDEQALCDLVGPFERLLHAEYQQEALQALGVASQVRQLQVPESEGYWVHLPPLATKKEALQQLRDIQAKQIDSYLIPKGELANGISFGMFTRKELAEARLAQMRELGYPAESLLVERSRTENWVLLLPGEAVKLSAAKWSELLGEQNGVKKQQKFCSGVASE
ncbi:SPOR domain-containing protein [Gilvimarinus xylanilyticus]|uniref:SPOR domain-containing protein n=1 Tax=Gilvimarinus xylanilyticus TaxID=2944139 RepID=A0A9X2KUF7_9GAMM|nr:SPOR domain-containing protein [Gilvimarinus xylanilyticus]MCP8900881.1 SPOR domain-containing protein [Gilvimarinus xylanilyticus]